MNNARRRGCSKSCDEGRAAGDAEFYTKQTTSPLPSLFCIDAYLVRPQKITQTHYTPLLPWAGMVRRVRCSYEREGIWILTCRPAFALWDFCVFPAASFGAAFPPIDFPFPPGMLKSYRDWGRSDGYVASIKALKQSGSALAEKAIRRVASTRVVDG